ncbi:MAG: hypothetical protein KGJ62_02505 [Armatimonadetes bacterium]|nr:hypothetical protein [Armatimonadota bacterium]MDE2205307.1 hypothetical protein [Armatimonadota bacterium]
MKPTAPDETESAVRAIPEESTQAQAIREALANARSRKALVRESAVRRLRSLGPAGMDALLQIVKYEHEKRGKSRRIFLLFVCLHFSVFYLNRILLVLGMHRLPFAVSLLGTFGMIYGGALYFSQRGGSAMRALIDFDDIRVTGAVVEMLQLRDSWMYGLACRSLCRLLPRLRASDAAILNANQRSILNGVLPRAANHRPDLARAILAAIGQVGDAASLPAVTALATMRPGGRVRQDVVTAAQDCLQLLEPRAAAEESRRQLLRAAGNIGHEESLPRPAAPTAVDTIGLLLPSAAVPADGQTVSRNGTADPCEAATMIAERAVTAHKPPTGEAGHTSLSSNQL